MSKLAKFGPCTTCAEQCADHGGGQSFKDGCLCNDGYIIEKCKNSEKKDVSDSKKD